MNEQIITLFGAISQYWYGKSYFSYFLHKYKDQAVRVKVSSFGGEVSEALAISTLFAGHGNVTVEFVGFNASSATFMAFGAKHIEMHEDGMWLCHKCSVPVSIYSHLDAEKLEAKIKELQQDKKNAEAIDLMIAKKYADRSGKSIKEMLDLMTESKWLTAQEVLDLGFIDKVLPGVTKKANVTNEITNQLQALSLPVPVLDMEEPATAEPAVAAGLDGVVDKIINGVKEFFQPSNRNVQQPNKQTIMNEKFTLINQALNIQGVEEADGKVMLNVNQLQALNDAIAAAQDAKQQAADDLSAVIQDLDTLGEGVKNAADHKAKVEAIRAILNKIPNVPAATVNQDETGNKYKDVAVDPINDYE